MITTSKQITTHFHSTEFRCKCGCGRIYIDGELVKNLEALFKKLNASKCIISSGYRCSRHDVAVGGNGYGQHTKGYAADCVYYDKNNNIIPAKIVVCAAFDTGLFAGLANINANYLHLDVRKTGSYHGDETRGVSSYWTNPYQYYGVSSSDIETYTGKSTATPTATPTATSRKYQSHGQNKKWYPNVEMGSSDYAGVFGVAMDGLYIDDVEYCVKVGGKWLPPVKGRSDYAGIIGKPITDVAIKGKTYRVHNKTKNYWLDWVSGYDIKNKENGYAGNGSVIDAIQIK